MTGLFVFIAIVAVISIAAVAASAWYFESGVAASVVAIICILVFGTTTWWNWATTYRNDRWETCHVTGKDRGGKDGSYRVYTSDCGTLVNEDSTLRRKYNSADIWQKIPSKGVVELRIAGMRAGFLSHFPNIFDVREVKNQD